MSTCHNADFCITIGMPQSSSIPQSYKKKYFSTEENDKKLQELHVWPTCTFKYPNLN